MKNKGIVIFVVVILIIIGGFFLLNSFLKKDVIKQDVPVQQPIIGASLVVPNQAGGSDVFIEKVYLPKAGYIVIHKDNNGKPGDIIGESDFLQTGEKDNFLVNINEKVVTGDVLYAMLHTDDGDEIFKSSLDTPTLNKDGKPVFVKFNIVSDKAVDNKAS